MKIRSLLGAVGALAVLTVPAGGTPCTVPGSHVSLADAIGDPTCDPITLGAGDFRASVAIDRNLTLTGAGPAQTKLLAVPDLAALEIISPALLQLEGLSLLVHSDSLVTSAINKGSGASMTMLDVEISTAAPIPPQPPLDDAVALWNFANRVDSLGGESTFNLLGTFSIGNTVDPGGALPANSDGFAAAEGPDNDCTSSFGELFVSAGHELEQVAGGSLSVWARVRFDAFDGTDDIFRFGNANAPDGSTYELDFTNSHARFSVLGAGTPIETSVTHGESLSANNWYAVTGVFDSVAQTLSLRVYDPESGQKIGQTVSLGVAFSSLDVGTPTNLLFLEAPFNVNGCNQGGQLEGAAVWDRVLAGDEIVSLAGGTSDPIFQDGFESGTTEAWSTQSP